MKLIIATKNRNKLKEIENKFSSLAIELIPQTDIDNFPEVIEDGNSFEENAIKKAKTIAMHTGLPTMADDSGLVVDSLHGRPGIYSARYAGEKATDKENNELLLEEMRNIEPENRTASFVCVIAIVLPGGETFTARGECSGFITQEPVGSHGFGYDPLFFVKSYNKTMAEIPLDEKNKISHRAKALENAREILKKLKQ